MHKANDSLMVAPWCVARSSALHPVPVCACLTDTSHTSYHCSLWVDWCSEWFMLAWCSIVLHVCCSAACPQVNSPCVCVCMRACVALRRLWGGQRAKNLVLDGGICVKSERNWENEVGSNSPLYCLHLCSLFHLCYSSLLSCWQFLIPALMLSC